MTIHRNSPRVSPRVIAACVAVASLLVLAAGTPAASGDDDEPRKPAAGPSQGSVGVGDSLFWDGPQAQSTIGTNVGYGITNAFTSVPAETCGVGSNPDPCWAYKFDVTEAGTVQNPTILRVAIDANRRGDCFQLEAWAPGTYGQADKQPTSNRPQCPELVTTMLTPQQWTMEDRVTNPAVGTWTLRVVPFLVSDWRFRLRVKLEKAVEGTSSPVRPNLQAYPPYEFGFIAPASPAAGSAIDKQNPPGPPGISCTANEQAEAVEHGELPPLRCLRFSAAVYNVGKGPLDLLLLEDSLLGGRVTQRVRKDNGEVSHHHDAGEWTFHAAHQHSHYAGFIDFELYRVLDATGPRIDPKSTRRLDPSISGHKSGWHSNDQRMSDWRRIDQAPANEVLIQCRNNAEQCITQGQGWGDHYRWQRPGNYVEFPTKADGSNVDGHYVVRMVVDRDDRVLESHDGDNSAYAWIRVIGETVKICERGLGDSPWDPNKRIQAASSWPTPPGTTADSPSEACSN